MATKTKKERNAVNAVKDYIDSTAILRSFLAENDKTPLWDGTIFVYCSEPDKNENLIGTLKTQIKGTEVTEFKERERYRISRKELNLYLNEGGLFYFVVELIGYKAGHTCDKCAEASEIGTDGQFLAAFGKCREQHGSRNVTDELGCQNRGQGYIFLYYYSQGVVDETDPSQIAYQYKEEDEGKEKAVVHVFKCASVCRKNHQ